VPASTVTIKSPPLHPGGVILPPPIDSAPGYLSTPEEQIITPGAIGNSVAELIQQEVIAV
jgi:hypothetical protein